MSQKEYEQGLAIRRQMFGDAHVNRAMDNMDEFTKGFQDYVNEVCYGGIWARSGISLKTRSLLNLAILATLGRSQELKLHIRGALANGATREEMFEVFMQCAMYAGIPSANDAFRLAKEIFAENG